MHSPAIYSSRNETQQWFICRGLPHFIEPYGTVPAVWSCAAPVLVIAYVAGGLHALDLANWSLARNLAAAAFVIALLFATWMLTNRLRHRPALFRPRSLGDPMERPLFIRQRVNIGMVSVFSQAILITFVAVILALFFMLFGLLAIPVATAAFWTQLDDVNVLARWDVGGRTLVLSEPLLRVAGDSPGTGCAARLSPRRPQRLGFRRHVQYRGATRHVPPISLRRMDGRRRRHPREVRRPGNKGHQQHSDEPGHHRCAVRRRLGQSVPRHLFG